MTDINNIEKLINMLQSPTAGTRYEACESLRVLLKITPEAILALQNAVKDADSSVAEAAQSALNAQLARVRSIPEETPPIYYLAENKSDNSRRVSATLLILFGVTAACIVQFYVSLLTTYSSSPDRNGNILLINIGRVAVLSILVAPIISAVMLILKVGTHRIKIVIALGIILFFSSAALFLIIK